MKTSWLTKELGFKVLTIILFTIFVERAFEFLELSDLFNLLALLLTLIVILWYAYDTHRIAEQTIESNLRPVILRSGYIHRWKDIKFKYDKNGNIISGNPIQFTILKNIAKDIKGKIVVNGYEYELLFGNDISKIDTKNTWLSYIWTWMMPNNVIYACFITKDRKKTKEKNNIYIEYKDIENNQYLTTEDENFSQESLKK